MSMSDIAKVSDQIIEAIDAKDWGEVDRLQELLKELVEQQEEMIEVIRL